MLFPAWVTSAESDVERDRLRSRYLLNLAAAAFSPSGHLTALSTAIGLDRATLSAYAARGSRVPVEVAIKIERAVGREFVTREAFRPDIFGEEDARPE